MGRRLISQRRGKGSPTYKSPSFRARGKVTYPEAGGSIEGDVMEVLHDPGRSGLVARVRFDDNSERLVLAAEGIRVGERIKCGVSVPVKPGNTLSLAEIPEGTLISGIEVVDYEGFVELACANDKVQSWL